MRPKYKVGQHLHVKAHRNYKQAGEVLKVITSIKGTFVYRLCFPDGSEYSYGEWELQTSAEVKR